MRSETSADTSVSVLKSGSANAFHPVKQEVDANHTDNHYSCDYNYHSGRSVSASASRESPASRGASGSVRHRYSSSESWRAGNRQRDLSYSPRVKKSTRKCYECGDYSHSARECPDIECYVCREVGHIARDCRESSSRYQEEGSGIRYVRRMSIAGGINSSSPPDLVTMLNVDGMEMKFVIDTGSDVSIITENASEKLNLKLHKANTILVAVDDSACACKGRILSSSN